MLPNPDEILPAKERTSAVTMEDVAKASGVTATTVARALRGVGYVSPKTREKVLAVALELNYSVNTAARTLATGRTGAIAVITGFLDQIYYGHLVHLLHGELTQSGYQMKLILSRHEMKDWLDEARASAVDGVIVSGSHTLSEEAEFMSSHLARRCVFLDTFRHSNTDFVRIDLRGAVRQALETMIQRGCRRIAYVGNSGDEEFRPEFAHEDRLLTYLDVMRETGRECEYINSRPHLGQADRVRSLVEYFKTNGCPDGIICLHDELALFTHSALMECGVRVPEECILVGCDGLRQMEWVYPPLSAVTQPFEEACALAWRFLRRRLENPQLPPQHATLPAKLLIRGLDTG